MATNDHLVGREVVTDLIDYLGQVIGEDTVALMKVGPTTKVFLDLGITSIDFILLLELIEQKYPVSEKLTGWVADGTDTSLADLTVGDVAEFICHVMA